MNTDIGGQFGRWCAAARAPILIGAMTAIALLPTPRPDDLRRELRRLEPLMPDGDATRAYAHHEHLELMLCEALLAAAIVRSQRWYARREEQLAAFDRRSAATVARLRASGAVGPACAWDPSA
jgi:hypothetical protein